MPVRADAAFAALNEVVQPTVPISIGAGEGLAAAPAARQHATVAPLAMATACGRLIISLLVVQCATRSRPCRQRLPKRHAGPLRRIHAYKKSAGNSSKLQPNVTDYAKLRRN